MRLLSSKSKGVSGLIGILVFFLLIVAASPTAAQDCVFGDLADIPLDTQEQAAPGLVMFLVDDSGSMDFATMVEDKDYDPDENETKNFFFTGGMFLPLNRTGVSMSDHSNGVAYVFDNPGDQSYSSRDLEGEEHLYWQSQYHGINKMYYDPSVTYDPWPKWDDSGVNNDSPTWSDPNSNTAALDMDPDNPRSNPMDSYYTFNLNDAFYTFSDQPSTQYIVDHSDAVIDNTETGTLSDIIIDNCSAGFSASGPGWQTHSSGDYYDGGCGTEGLLTNSTGTYNVTWEQSGIDTDAAYEVYARWDDYKERGTAIPYTIHHSGGTDTYTVDQEQNGGTWVQLGTGTFTFASGTATIAIENYEVTGTDNGLQSDDEISADAIRLVCVSGCGMSVPPFQSSGPYSTASEWYEDGWDDDCLDEFYNLGGSNLRTEQAGDYTATWTAANLDPNTQYDIYAWWDDNSDRSDSVEYLIYDDTTDDTNQVATATANQRTTNDSEPQLLKSGVTFNSGTGIVKLDFTLDSAGVDNGGEVSADAIAFMPTPDTSGMPASISRAHYYVKNENGVFLVNLEGDSDTGDFHYYQVVDSDDDGMVDMAGGLVETTAASAGLEWIENQRSYKEERVNFANWYSFYRKRELTAKNAIANVLTSMEGVFIGLESINGDLGQELLPVNVDHNGTSVDETDYLLDTLYNNWNSSGGTPLRSGLNYVGEYFSGEHQPGSIYTIDGTAYTTSTYYPFFRPDEGGACEQAFCITMTDGFWNGYLYSDEQVGDADADATDNEFDGGIYYGAADNTLADIAMAYYKNDLNGNIADLVPTTTEDQASHQHMVTYGVSFGADGTLNPDLYDCSANSSTCASNDSPDNCCPIWPDPGSDDNPRKIDDLYHASVNGRGKFLNAGNPQELISAMSTLRQDIQSRLGSAASVATNSIQRTVGTYLYQGIYNTNNWYGDVLRLKIDVDTGEVIPPDPDDPASWSASKQLEDEAYGDRQIITYDGTAGVPFRYGESGVPYVEGLVNYLRGDDQNNIANGGPYRVRSSKLGDVVHSAPEYQNGVVYVGGNDGMLHAFDAETGEELFAYVPKILIDKGSLPDLASTDYSHQFYVDNSPYARKINDSTTLLVGGLRKGGKGYFCLDVTNAGSNSSPITESDASSVVKWEYAADSDGDGVVDDPDMGYSYSPGYIVKTEAAGWVVIFGNGYDSSNGKAVLYIIDIDDSTGALGTVTKLDTGVSGCNGLSAPAVTDVNADGYADYVYAGDLKGNLWKFDLGDTNNNGTYEVSDWEIAYNDGSGTPKPLITVNNASGGQPITVEPDVMGMNCRGDQKGYFVVFGTGQYIGMTDFDDTSQQTFYGVWDWQDGFSTQQAQRYLGDFTATQSDPTLSNPPVDADSLTLLEQTATDVTGGEWRDFSDNAISYYTPGDPDSDSDPDHAGWYFNLIDSRARVIRNPSIRSGTGRDLAIVNFISSIPSESPCEAGGNSWLYRVSACNGGEAYGAQFDTNADQKIDHQDDPAKSGKSFSEMIYSPTSIGDKDYITDSTGKINEETTTENPEGMSYWRVIQ